MIKCYRCGSEDCVKNGFMQGYQRYKCKGCGQNFIDKPRRGYGKVAIGLAVWLHISGVSQRRIAQMFNVTPVAVQKWIKEFKFPTRPTP